MSRSLQQRVFFFAIALLMSVHFAMTYARALPPAFANLHTFAYGPIDVPYRPRVLMRWIYAGAYRLTQDHPPAMAHGVMTAMQVTIFFIVAAAVMALIYMTRASIGHLLGRESRLRWFSLVTVYMCAYQYLLTPQIRAQFPYDVPAVAVFATCIFAIFRKNRWLYYPVFLIGTFNRETTMFLPPLFLILALDDVVPLFEALKRMSVWRYAEAAVQMVVWAGIVHWCNVTTNAVLGPTWALPKNLHFLLSPMHWPTLLSVYAFLWVPWLLFFKRIGHVNLQRAAILLPFWSAAMLWKADLLEIRVQAEWIPYFAICLALILRNSLLLREDVTEAAIASPSVLPGTSLL